MNNRNRILAPWLQSQLESLPHQRGHAWLLAGPSGLGQFDLALALARAWLCETPRRKALAAFAAAATPSMCTPMPIWRC